MITRINHIGIAVRNIDDYLKIYTEWLGLELGSVEVMVEQKARTAIIPVGESRIELVEPTAPEGPIGKFLEQRGEGLHHLALEVDDIEAAIADLVQKGVPLVDAKPRGGVEGSRIIFLHPRQPKVLIELVEPAKK